VDLDRRATALTPEILRFAMTGVVGGEPDRRAMALMPEILRFTQDDFVIEIEIR
jgi:hypothetical protein